MANAYTTPSDVFKPQAIGQALKGYLMNSMALLSSGYVGDIAGATWSNGGNQVTFPKYTGFTGSSSTNPIDGTSIDSKKVTVTSVTADAVAKILSIAVDKYTFEYAAKDPALYNMIIEQVGAVVRDEIDKALVTEAETTTLSYDYSATGTITFDVVIDALKLWGDKMAASDAMIVVHSKVYADILKVADFKDAAKFGLPTQISGAVPFLAGLPVFVSDNVTFTDDTTDTYTNLIVRRNSLRLGMRSDVAMEVKTEPGNTMRFLDFDWAYVVDLAQSAQLGAIKLITQ